MSKKKISPEYPTPPTLTQWLGHNIIFDSDGTQIYAVQGHAPNEGLQIIADVRGWGAIQNLFKMYNGAIDMDAAAKFQDQLGQFIATAITEKLERENELQRLVQDQPKGL